MSDDRIKYKPIIVKNKPTKKEQLYLVENHPAFTGECTNCGYKYNSDEILKLNVNSKHWDCPNCGVSY